MSKNSKSRSDVAVQGTNDSSVVSKCSITQRGYFTDPYLKHMVTKTSRRAPLINRGYFIRAACIDHMLKTFLKSTTGKKQILSVGAGFDSAFFRLKAQGLLEDCVFYEIDFPDLVKRKTLLIKATEELTQLVNFAAHQPDSPLPAVINTADYKLIGVDLCQLGALESCLKDCGIDVEAPTLLLSEVVITYMHHKRSSSLIWWSAKFFMNAVFMSYEQIQPDDAFGIVMMNHFQSLGSPLKAIRSFPTLASQVHRYIDKGWQECRAADMNYFFDKMVPLAERRRVSDLEPFDEFEEWHVKCSHYIIICAFTGDCVESADKMLHILASTDNSHNEILSATDVNDSNSTGYSYRQNQQNRHGTCAKSTESSINGAFQNGEISTNGKLDEITNDCVDGEQIEGHLLGVNKEQFSSSLKPVHIDQVPVADEIKVFGHTTTSLPNGDLIIVGGFGEIKGKHERVARIRVMKANSHDIYECTASVAMERMCHSATLLPDGRIFIFGGRTSPTRPCARSVLLKIEQSQDDEQQCVKASLESVPQEGQTDIRYCCHATELPLDEKSPCARWRHSATLISYQGKDCVAIFGGRTAGDPVLGDLHLWEVANQTWQVGPLRPSGQLPDPRHSHTASNWNGTIVVAGGLGRDMQPLNSVHLLNMEDLYWRRIALSGEFKPRYSHSSNILGNKLLLLGGVNKHSQPPGLAVIDLATQTCQEYPLPCQEPQRPLMFHNHTSVVASDEEELLVIGGGGNCFSFGTHLNASPIKDLMFTPSFRLPAQSLLRRLPSQTMIREVMADSDQV